MVIDYQVSLKETRRAQQTIQKLKWIKLELQRTVSDATKKGDARWSTFSGQIYWGVLSCLHAKRLGKWGEYWWPDYDYQKRLLMGKSIQISCFRAEQGGRSWGSAGAALPERSGSSTKGRTSNIRYFVAKPSIVAIYALFERLSQGFQLKPSCSHRACFLRAFNKSNPSFVELSTKALLLS